MTLLERINLLLLKVQVLRQSPESRSTPLGHLSYRDVNTVVQVPKCYSPRVNDMTHLTRAEVEQGIARIKLCLGHDDDEKCEVCGND